MTNRADAAPIIDISAYRLGKKIALPEGEKGLLLHAFGPVLGVNKTMGAILDINPGEIAGLRNSVDRYCTPESRSIIKQHLTGLRPAKYETEFLSGRRVLTESYAMDFHGIYCRMAEMTKLGRWI